MNKDIADDLLDMGSRIDPVMESLFSDVADEDFLNVPFRHHMGSGGKRIRPALCLLTCRELGGKPDLALYFAAAVEILHNMFLVHDDLQDGDEMRRDKQAVWVKFGPANAINLGDYMLGRAYTAILDSPVDADMICSLTRLFTNTYENTCRGQALDLNWRGTEDMTVDKYLRMVQLKTADYLVLGMIGGAMIAGASRRVEDSIRLLGQSMGPAFQIRDDVIDLTTGKGRGGELGNDIREGKPSILFAHALNAAKPADRRFLLDVAGKERERTNEEEVKQVIQIYEKYGSITFASAKADDLTKQAYDEVKNIPLENKDIFRRIIRFMAERTK